MHRPWSGYYIPGKNPITTTFLRFASNGLELIYLEGKAMELGMVEEPEEGLGRKDEDLDDG